AANVARERAACPLLLARPTILPALRATVLSDRALAVGQRSGPPLAHLAHRPSAPPPPNDTSGRVLIPPALTKNTSPTFRRTARLSLLILGRSPFDLSRFNRSDRTPRITRPAQRPPDEPKNIHLRGLGCIR